MPWIKKAYLYIVSLISLVIMVISGIMLINIALKAWVFQGADTYISYPIQNCPVAAPDASVKSVPLTDCKPSAEQQAQEATYQRENTRTQRQRDAAQAIAMLIVATPVFYYHWKYARKES